MWDCVIRMRLLFALDAAFWSELLKCLSCGISVTGNRILWMNILQSFVYSSIWVCFYARRAIKQDFLCINVCWAPWEDFRPLPFRLEFSTPSLEPSKYERLENDVWPYVQAMSVRSHYLSQLITLLYLSHRRPVKAQVSLRIRVVSPEPSLFAHMKYGSRRRVR